MTIRPWDPANPTVSTELIVKELLELNDMAKEQKNLHVALQALALIAQIQGMLDDED